MSLCAELPPRQRWAQQLCLRDVGIEDLGLASKPSTGLFEGETRRTPSPPGW